MTRRLFILTTREKRKLVANIIASLPKFARVEIKDPKRTIPQNDKMWAMLTEFAEQAAWGGEQLTTFEWKDMFTGAVKVAGGGVRAVPGLEGGIMLLGLHTSDMSVAEMADLITYMTMKAPELGVVLNDPAEDQGVPNTAPSRAAA